jgi:hypothetical protein
MNHATAEARVLSVAEMNKFSAKCDTCKECTCKFVAPNKVRILCERHSSAGGTVTKQK